MSRKNWAKSFKNMEDMVRIRQATVNIILAAVFILMIYVIVTPLFAEVRFDYARKLVDGYQWPKAEIEFESAMSIDPFNSEYPASLGAFLLRQSGYADNKAPLLKRAAGLYERALGLNPRSAEYALGAGRARIDLFLEDMERYKEEPGKAFGFFEKALRNDPKGFNISYSVGYIGMSVWDILDESAKNLVLERLRYSLTVKPQYGIHIYPKIWKKTSDFHYLERVTPDTLAAHAGLYSFIISSNLNQFRKKESDILNYYRTKEEPGKFKNEETERAGRIENVRKVKKDAGTTVAQNDWSGIAADGKNAYKGGSMYWTGTMDGAILVPKGEAVIGIRAKGEPAGGICPYMIVELDGKWIGETSVGPEWKECEFSVDTDGGVKVLSITFANDGSGADGREDRNLYVGAARVVKI